MEFTKREKLKEKPKGALGFGKYFSDYMYKLDYTIEKGWHNERIEPYAPLALDPSTTVLHYGQAIFEGMKAYLNANGDITMFRPEENFLRMNKSCERMCIPELNVEQVLNGLKELVKLEKDWIPKDAGTSLYIRPTIIATDAALGVHASHSYLFFIILCPVGAYYAEGLKPIKIYVEDTFVRAAIGGTGEAKCIGNYAGSLKAGAEAAKKGYTQVLWLDAKEKRYVEEVGAMNMFFIIENELITPKLVGSILPGITRKSIIQLAKDRGLNVVERQISIEEIIGAIKEGRLSEAFGTGTAAVVSPVGTICYKDVDYDINGGAMGACTQKLYDELTGIQTGKVEDRLNWVTTLNK